jgi:uncharacterized membrane protein
MLAVSFFNPLLLGGLVLVALPILIHWLFRRRYRRIEWAAMHFLLEAQRETRRRRRFEQWLLLALRCLAIGLLALFLARPFVQPGDLANLFAGSEAIDRIIVLDDTGSLNSRTQGNSEFESVKEIAVKVLGWIAEASPRDRLTLLRWSAPDEPLIERESLDALQRGELERRIAVLEPTPLHTSLTSLVSALRKWIERDDGPERVDIHLITDQQTGQFEDLPPGLLTEFAGAKSGIRWIVMPTGDFARNNVAMTSVKSSQPYAIAGQPLRLQTTLRHEGKTALSNLSLGVAIDGDPVPGVVVEHLPASGEITLEHELVLAEPGYPTITVSLPAGDDYPLDDSWQLVIPSKPALNVLVISAATESSSRKDSAYYLEQALAPPGPFSSGIMVTTLRPADLAGTALAAFDAVLLANVSELDPAALTALQAYVARGGGAAFFAGDQISDVTSFNARFHAGGDGLYPVELRRRISAGSELVGMLRSAEHPVTVAIPEAIERSAPLVRFQTYYSSVIPDTQSDTAAEHPVHVLAHFNDPQRTAALVEHNFGRGRVVAFLSSVDLRWNNWPGAIDGSFVITMLELVRYLAGESNYPTALTVGEPISLPLDLDRYETEASIQPPNFPAVPSVSVSAAVESGSSSQAVLTSPATTLLGSYAVRLMPRVGEPESFPVAVNADPRESALQRATTAQLNQWFAGTDFVLADSLADSAPSASTRHELWRMLLIGLILTLLIEQFLAWWFGRDAQETAARQARHRTLQGVGR